jgi:hypothetical protein
LGCRLLPGIHSNNFISERSKNKNERGMKKIDNLMNNLG